MTALALLGLGLRWGGLSLVVGGLVAAVPAAVRTQPRDAPAWRRRLTRIRQRLAGRYDASAGGRRLRARLDAATLAATPSGWRLAQGAGILAVAPAVHQVVGSPLATLGLSATTIRLASAMVLRCRRRRRDDLLEELSGRIARHLAVELRGGADPAEAILSLRAAGSWRPAPAAAAFIEALGTRVGGGVPVGTALDHLASAEPPGRGPRALARLARLLVLSLEGGAGPAPLLRHADVVDAGRRQRAEIAAATAEARGAAIAVPALAAVVVAGMAIENPGVGAALLGLPAAPIVALCATVALAGSMTARRLVQT